MPIADLITLMERFVSREAAPVASISNVIGPEWLQLAPVRVGGAPPGQGTADRYVTITAREHPFLRVDVYAYDAARIAARYKARRPT